MESGFTIRKADIRDAERLLEIYSYYVLNTAVSFEYTAPSVSEFENRIKTTMEKYPFLVCVRNDTVEGYAYAGSYSSREAYSWTAAASIYIDKGLRRQGIGSALYRELENELRGMGIINVLAGVAYCENEDEYLTHDSYKFHLKMGYVKAAQLISVGKKFDRWYDLLWMQKKL